MVSQEQSFGHFALEQGGPFTPVSRCSSGVRKYFWLLAAALAINFWFVSPSTCRFNDAAESKATHHKATHFRNSTPSSTFWSSVEPLSTSSAVVVRERFVQNPSQNVPHFNQTLHQIQTLYASPEVDVLHIQRHATAKPKSACRISYVAHFQDAVLSSCFSITTKSGQFYAYQDFGSECRKECAGFCSHWKPWKEKGQDSAMIPPQHRSPNATVIHVPKLLIALFRWGTEFQHMLKDVLPRLVMAKDLLATDNEIQVLLQDSHRVREMLQRIQFPLDRVLWAPAKKAWTLYSDRPILMYQAEHLYLPHCHPGPPWTGAFPSALYQYHREMLAPKIPATSLAATAIQSGNRKAAIIYVSRAGGANSQSRTITNERELVGSLKSTFEPIFEVVNFIGGNRTLHDNMALFARAAAVVGPHGGGFYNIAASPPGTVVLELVPDDYGRCEVHGFATKLGHWYRSIMKRGMSKKDSFGKAPLDWIISMLKQTLIPEQERFQADAPLLELPKHWKRLGADDCAMN